MAGEEKKPVAACGTPSPYATLAWKPRKQVWNDTVHVPMELLRGSLKLLLAPTCARKDKSPLSSVHPKGLLQATPSKVSDGWLGSSGFKASVCHSGMQ